MKYFTPDLLVQLDARDSAAANAADAEWDRRHDEYESHLAQILPGLPAHLQEYNELLLHDAEVRCVIREGDQLIFTVRKDIPPREVIQICYTLVADPIIDPTAIPRESPNGGMYYLYNEFDLVQEEDRTLYSESILFSNGWEMQLKYSDVRVALAQAIYPVPDSPPPLAQSA